MTSGGCSRGHVFSGDRCPYCALDILERGLRELIYEHPGSDMAREAQKFLPVVSLRPKREIATLNKAMDRVLNRLEGMKRPKSRWKRWVIDPARRVGWAISRNPVMSALRDGTSIASLVFAILAVLILYALTVIGLHVSLCIDQVLGASRPKLRVMRDFLANDGVWFVPLCAFLIGLGVYVL